MNKSPNLPPPHTEWQRYESPAVLRKHGREYLERFWTLAAAEPVESTLDRLVRDFGAGLQAGDDTILLSCDDLEAAAACMRHLRRCSGLEIDTLLIQLTINRQVTP